MWLLISSIWRATRFTVVVPTSVVLVGVPDALAQENGLEFAQQVEVGPVRDANGGLAHVGSLDSPLAFATDTYRMAIQFAWRWNNDQGDETRITDSFPLTFLPTGMVVLPNERLAIAGVRIDGTPILELWKLSVPDAVSYTDDPVTGEVTKSYVLGVERKRTVLAGEPDSGKSAIVNLMQASGAGDALLYQRADSGHFYYLDLATGSSTVFVAASPVEGYVGPIVPELRCQLYDRRLWGLHQSHGMVYHLSVESCSDGSPTRLIRLIDADEDGDVDQAEAFVTVPYVTDADEYEWRAPASYAFFADASWD